jgi:hypothetical protein
LPSAIAVTSSEIYWLDDGEERFQIVQTDLEGEGHRVVVERHGEPWEIAVVGSTVFWSEQSDKNAPFILYRMATVGGKPTRLFEVDPSRLVADKGAVYATQRGQPVAVSPTSVSARALASSRLPCDIVAGGKLAKRGHELYVSCGGLWSISTQEPAGKATQLSTNQYSDIATGDALYGLELVSNSRDGSVEKTLLHLLHSGDGDDKSFELPKGWSHGFRGDSRAAYLRLFSNPPFRDALYEVRGGDFELLADDLSGIVGLALSDDFVYYGDSTGLYRIPR